MKKYLGYVFDIYLFLIILFVGLFYLLELNLIIWDSLQISSQIFDELYKSLINSFNTGQNFIFFGILIPVIIYWVLFRRVPPFLKSKIFSYASISLIILLSFAYGYQRVVPVNYASWYCEPEFLYTDPSKGSLYNRNIPVYDKIEILVHKNKSVIYQAPLARHYDQCYFHTMYDFLDDNTFNPFHSSAMKDKELKLCPVRVATFSSGFRDYLNDMKKTHEMVNKDNFFLNPDSDLNNKYDFILNYSFDGYSFNDDFEGVHSMNANCTLGRSVIGKWFTDHEFVRGRYWEHVKYVRER